MCVCVAYDVWVVVIMMMIEFCLIGFCVCVWLVGFIWKIKYYICYIISLVGLLRE